MRTYAIGDQVRFVDDPKHQLSTALPELLGRTGTVVESPHATRGVYRVWLDHTAGRITSPRFSVGSEVAMGWDQLESCDNDNEALE